MKLLNQTKPRTESYNIYLQLLIRSLGIFGPSSKNTHNNYYALWAVTLSTGYNHRHHLLFIKIKTHNVLGHLLTYLSSNPVSCSWNGYLPRAHWEPDPFLAAQALSHWDWQLAQPIQTPPQTSTWWGCTVYTVYSTACSFCHYPSIITTRKPEARRMQFLPVLKLKFYYAKFPLCPLDLTPEVRWNAKHYSAHRAFSPCSASFSTGPRGLVILLEFTYGINMTSVTSLSVLSSPDPSIRSLMYVGK